MKSIYELQEIANRLRVKTETDSISPEDTFGLQSDVLAYIADMEQSADGLGIRKVYKTKAVMETDTEPVGTNGKALRYGQLVSIYDSDNATCPENGNIYAWQKPGWLLMGNIGCIYELKEKIEAEKTERKNADAILSQNISDLTKHVDDQDTEISDIKIIATTAMNGATARFYGFVLSAEIKLASSTATNGKVVYVKSKKKFAYAVRNGLNVEYFGNWAPEGIAPAIMYMDSTLTEVLKDKIFIYNGLLYVWDDEENDLVMVGGGSAGGEYEVMTEVDIDKLFG